MKRIKICLALVSATVVAALSGVAGDAATKHTVTRVADGGECTLEDAKNVYAAVNAISQVFFEGSGTLKLTGSGASAVVRTTLVATNGTLTIDVSEFEFTDTSNKKLELQGGIYCGESGKLDISRSDVHSVQVGYPTATGALNMPVYLRNVDLGDASLVFTAVGIWALPDKSKVDWTIDTSMPLWLWGEDALKDIADDNGLITWNNISIAINGDNVIAKGRTLTSKSNTTVTLYPCYTPEVNVSGDWYVDYLNRYGKPRRLEGNIRLDSSCAVSANVRGAKMYGDVECGKLVLNSNKGTGVANANDFFGTVEVSTMVSFTASANQGQWARFFGVCFTNGVPLSFKGNAKTPGTNNTMFIVKALDKEYTPHFTTVAFESEPAEGRIYAHHSAMVISNLTVKVGAVTNGVGIIRGNGTLRLGRIDNGAELYVENGITIEKDPEVAGSFFSREGSNGSYTIYFACSGEDGALDLNTDTSAEEVTFGACDGAIVIAATNGTPNVQIQSMDGAKVMVRTLGDTWQDNERITHWFDFSDFSTMTQVVATAEPPTSEGAAGGKVLTGNELGPKSVKVRPLDDKKEYGYPAIESVIDVRGAEYGKRCYNGRMYQSAKTGTNEWWDSVYMGYVTNDTRCVNHYLSAGPWGQARRLEFEQNYHPSFKSVTMVFGSQLGGGAALLSLDDNGTALGRLQGKENPIATNGIYRFVVDGVEVDPTVAKFNGGWQVITIQCTNNYNRGIRGLGYSRAVNGDNRDTGGQNYGEMVIYNSLPTEDERIALEKYLADKWGIPYEGHPQAEVKFNGAASAKVSGNCQLSGSLTGNVELNKAKVTLPTSGTFSVSGDGWVKVAGRSSLPTFADDFRGFVELGTKAWNFKVDAEQGEVVDPIDIGEAKFWVTNSAVSVSITNTSSVADFGPLSLVTGGGFVGNPVWSAVLAEPYAEKSGEVVLEQTSTDLMGSLSSRKGMMFIFK